MSIKNTYFKTFKKSYQTKTFFVVHEERERKKLPFFHIKS